MGKPVDAGFAEFGSLLFAIKQGNAFEYPAGNTDKDVDE